jgi:hypothetical protein
VQDNTPYRAISLGWGVQSWTLAAMVALGALPPVDVALHADTGHEMQSTYAFARQWAPWLERHGMRVVTVHASGTRGTQVITHVGEIEIPAFTVAENGKRGQVRRQCTGHWKINPLRKYIQAQRNGRPAALWLGITTDEWHRASDSKVQYLTHEYPLLALGMSRADCLAWLADHELPAPSKSSCTFCPFHNKLAWQRMKRAGGPDWEEAITVDSAIRNTMLPGQLFLHTKGLPLGDAVVIPEDFGYTQLELLASDDRDAECDSGHCFL